MLTCGGNMSLWLESYSSYHINRTDPPNEIEEKMHHILCHLSMPVFQNMDINTRLEFLVEAQNMLNYVSNPSMHFSIPHLIALRYLKNDIEAKDLERIYQDTNRKVELHPEILKYRVIKDVSYNNRCLWYLPRVLSKSNIDEIIAIYYDLLDDIPNKIEADNCIKLFMEIKRGYIQRGPYPNVSVFETANRVMTDLVLLYGVKELLNGAFPELRYDSISVEYGNENSKSNDIVAERNSRRLRGECFNVSKSLFKLKIGRSLQKLRRQASEDDDLIVVYNSDAVSDSNQLRKKDGIYYLPIKIPHI